MKFPQPKPPGGLLEGAKELGETYSWVERCVWTDRMLRALATGPRGRKWYSLMDKVASQETLLRAFEEVARNGGASGVDHVSVDAFASRRDEEIRDLSQRLRDGTYRPQPVRRVWLPKPGSRERRPLGVPTVRDRVVQRAMTYVLEPIFEMSFSERSFGFRPGRSAHAALGVVEAELVSGKTWVLDIDIRAYFDSISHERLLGLLSEKVSDRSLLSLVDSMLKAGVLCEGELIPSEMGTPQGGVISPLLANLYLDGLDKLLESRGISHVRYADDMVVLCPTREAAEAALALAGEWMTAAGLSLHPEKTRLVDMTLTRSSFDFLGYRFHRSDTGKLQTLVRPKSETSLKERVRFITRRLGGYSLAVTVEDLNTLIRGYTSYFRHACRQQFVQLDRWIRARLRGLLRKRQGRRGRGGSAHVIWPINYFEAQGLHSLAATWNMLQQPSPR